ncbi:MAG: hypothetical protein Q4P66_05255 [Actinomycetaceae bacterium]|nr:hypothetical protein [Actinomycetaceae bacterium]
MTFFRGRPALHEMKLADSACHSLTLGAHHSRGIPSDHLLDKEGFDADGLDDSFTAYGSPSTGRCLAGVSDRFRRLCALFGCIVVTASLTGCHVRLDTNQPQQRISVNEVARNNAAWCAHQTLKELTHYSPATSSSATDSDSSAQEASSQAAHEAFERLKDHADERMKAFGEIWPDRSADKDAPQLPAMPRISGVGAVFGFCTLQPQLDYKVTTDPTLRSLLFSSSIGYELDTAVLKTIDPDQAQIAKKVADPANTTPVDSDSTDSDSHKAQADSSHNDPERIASPVQAQELVFDEDSYSYRPTTSPSHSPSTHKQTNTQETKDTTKSDTGTNSNTDSSGKKPGITPTSDTKTSSTHSSNTHTGKPHPNEAQPQEHSSQDVPTLEQIVVSLDQARWSLGVASTKAGYGVGSDERHELETLLNRIESTTETYADATKEDPRKITYQMVESDPHHQGITADIASSLDQVLRSYILLAGHTIDSGHIDLRQETLAVIAYDKIITGEDQGALPGVVLSSVATKRKD